MAQAHPLRRRDRGGHLDEDYATGGPYGYYDDARMASPRYRDDSPPRRERARPSRRAPSPDYPPQPRYESPPRRSRSVRQPPPPSYGADSPPRRHRGGSPPPYTAELPRRDRRAPPGPRNTFPSDYDRAGYGGVYAQDPRDRPSRSSRYEDPEPRSRRSRYASPSPERRRGGRERPPTSYDHSPPRRHRSANGRAPPPVAAYGVRGASPPRSRPPQATAGRPAAGGRPRRNSMPSATATKAAKSGWWTNPLIQASARTALTAGAQAAMSSRKDKGAWIGPKGAKVASAALMGGIMDGFMANKSGGGGGGGSHAPPPAAGPGGGMKAEFMRQGMEAALGRFGGSGSKR